MAKTSSIEKNKKRIRLAALHDKKRLELKERSKKSFTSNGRTISSSSRISKNSS
jgi:hypothetical protein